MPNDRGTDHCPDGPDDAPAPARRFWRGAAVVVPAALLLWAIALAAAAAVWWVFR